MRAGQKMTAKDSRNPGAAERAGGATDSAAQHQQSNTPAQRSDGGQLSTRGSAAGGGAGGGLTQRANPNVNASQNPKGGATTGKATQPAPTSGSLRGSRPTTTVPASSARTKAPAAPPPPQQAPLVRGKVMTPANKYVHVPSNVLRSAPVTRVGGAAAPAVAPSNPKKALSRAEFFGTGSGSKKTQHVKSVLHASKYFPASKNEDDRAREEGSVAPRSTTESNLTTNSVAAETPTTSWTATCTGGGRPALVPVSSVESTTFEAIVLSEDADVAPRRSLSLSSSNPSQPVSALARKTVDQTGANAAAATIAHSSASAVADSPRHSGRGSGLIQWLLSPILGGRRPSGEEPDERRAADSNAVVNISTSSNDSVAGVRRGSFQQPAPSAAPSAASQGPKLSADLLSRDTQRGSDVLSLFSETDAPSSPARKSSTRTSMLLSTPHLPPPPPNTPVGANSLRPDTPARRSLSLDMSSGSRPSVGVPAAPPNTPVAPDATEHQLQPPLLGSPLPQQDDNSAVARPPLRGSTGWWPFLPAVSADRRDSAARSGSGSLRASTEVHASASSIAAAFDDTEPLSVSNTVFPSDDGREDAGRFSSVTGSWFGRIRNSLLLPMGSASQSAQRGERDDPTSPPPTVDESQPKRRKSVVFRSPEGLETRVEESFIVGSTTPSALPTHNVDASSPIPILLRSSSNYQEVPHPVLEYASTAPGIDDAPRSDSPSRKDEKVAPFEDAAASGDVASKFAAISSEFAQSPPPRPPADPSLDSESAAQPGAPNELRHAAVRSHAVDRHGRVLRKSTPAPTDLPSQLLSPPIPTSESCSTSPPPAAQDDVQTPVGVAVPDASARLPVDADHRRVDFVIRNHTVPSALRMLTVGDIAGFLVEHNVAFDPADKKAKLFDAARQLVFSDRSERSATNSTARKRSREEAEEPSERSLELPLAAAEEGLPTSSWTVADIRGYAVSKGIALPNGSVRKAELLRHVSASAGRSRSISLALA